VNLFWKGAEEMIDRRKALSWNRNSLLRKGASALLITSLAVTSCWAKGSKTPKNPPDVHQQVEKLGPGAKVDVVLADGSLQKGKIKSIDDQSFALDDKEAGVSTISYASVTSVHRDGLSGNQVGILVVAGVVVVLVVGFAIVAHQHFNIRF
jgi:hypothetical protein